MSRATDETGRFEPCNGGVEPPRLRLQREHFARAYRQRQRARRVHPGGPGHRPAEQPAEPGRCSGQQPAAAPARAGWPRSATRCIRELRNLARGPGQGSNARSAARRRKQLATGPEQGRAVQVRPLQHALRQAGAACRMRILAGRGVPAGVERGAVAGQERAPWPTGGFSAARPRSSRRRACANTKTPPIASSSLARGRAA